MSRKEGRAPKQWGTRGRGGYKTFHRVFISLFPLFFFCVCMVFCLEKRTSAGRYPLQDINFSLQEFLFSLFSCRMREGQRSLQLDQEKVARQVDKLVGAVENETLVHTGLL